MSNDNDVLMHIISSVQQLQYSEKLYKIFFEILKNKILYHFTHGALLCFSMYALTRSTIAFAMSSSVAVLPKNVWNFPWGSSR
mmetsp:Transcript_79/g.176  ORF Transcript_79/g.176 Transcript_79/m.176 type:complete len:83 (-) Transcript_79:816-1064(-)